MIFRYLYPIYIIKGTHINLFGEYKTYEVIHDFTAFWIDRDMMYIEIGKELSERIILLYYKCKKIIWYDSLIDRFINVPGDFISMIYGDVENTPILIHKNIERYFKMYRGYTHVTKNRVEKLNSIQCGYIEVPEALATENISVFSYFYPIHIPVNSCITRNKGHYIMIKPRSGLSIDIRSILHRCNLECRCSEIPSHIDIPDIEDPYTCDFCECFARVENIKDNECRPRKGGEHPIGRCTRDIKSKAVVIFKYRGNIIVTYNSSNTKAMEIRYAPVSIYNKYITSFSDLTCVYQ